MNRQEPPSCVAENAVTENTIPEQQLLIIIMRLNVSLIVAHRIFLRWIEYFGKGWVMSLIEN